MTKTVDKYLVTDVYIQGVTPDMALQDHHDGKDGFALGWSAPYPGRAPSFLRGMVVFDGERPNEGLPSALTEAARKRASQEIAIVMSLEIEPSVISIGGVVSVQAEQSMVRSAVEARNLHGKI